MAADQVKALDPSDPYARAAQTFPVLPPAMIERMLPYGSEEDAEAGAYLFMRGQRSIDFFLVLAGTVEISDQGADGTANIFTRHGPGQFTGELDLFNDREVLVSARAGADTRVLRVRRADFRRMTSTEPDIGEIIMRAFILRRVGLIQHAHGGVTLVGSAKASDTLRIERFLVRNGYPMRLLDTDSDPDAEGFLTCFNLDPSELPVVVLPQHRLLRRPATPDLADALGLTEELDAAAVHDLIVVGAGPAGLAAAVYGASEGLDTIVVEALAPGGQAGTSSKIENYLGFPTGISGQALAGRAQVQAQKFGARLAISRRAIRLDCHARPMRLHLEDGRSIAARAVIVATGARYRKLDVPGYEQFEGQGIHYAATAMEAQLCSEQEVIVVGGGNSAGQAAVFLSRMAAHVHVLVRATGLAATMSDYLVQRIHSSPRITLHAESEITSLAGGTYLEEVSWRHRRTGEAQTRPIGNVFVMIGAEPNTDWLDGCLDLDGKGFVVTGFDSPYATSQPGVFAVGDVRADSVKRVASGVGEGSVVISYVHRFLEPAA